MVTKKAIQTTGKRKSAVARATLIPGKGIIKINNQNISTLKNSFLKDRLMEPLILSEDTWKKVNINVRVSGGGIQGQTEAARSAIARALVEFNKKLRKPFIEYDRHLIVWDVRAKEPRKPNDSKARAKRQKSYR